MVALRLAVDLAALVHLGADARVLRVGEGVAGEGPGLREGVPVAVVLAAEALVHQLEGVEGLELAPPLDRPVDRPAVGAAGLEELAADGVVAARERLVHEHARRAQGGRRRLAAEGLLGLDHQEGRLHVVAERDRRGHDATVGPQGDVEAARLHEEPVAHEGEQLLGALPQLRVRPGPQQLRVGLEEVDVVVHRAVGGGPVDRLARPALVLRHRERLSVRLHRAAVAGAEVVAVVVLDPAPARASRARGARRRRVAACAAARP